MNKRLWVYTGSILLVYLLGYLHFIFNFLASISTFAFSIPLWLAIFILGTKTGRAIKYSGERGNMQENKGGKRPPPPPIIIDLRQKEEEKVLIPA